MNEENINKLRVLVAPLDWGLGHATRCIPIVRALLNAGYEPVIAADGPIKALLTKEFPSLSFLTLPGYQIRYSRNPRWLAINLILQAPRIIMAIRSEKRWLHDQVVKQNIRLVISDNRFGMWHPAIPSIYMTHQLHIETGKNWLNRVAQRINYSLIRNFSKCWVPDNADAANLGGLLSHPVLKPSIPVEYIGTLSRFSPRPMVKKINLLVVLSGVEPQRSILEDLLITQIRSFNLTATIVRGIPGEGSLLGDTPGIEVIQYANSQHLEELLLSAHTVICRSGYSSVMDLSVLGIRAILIPTPGQAEQEYLATYLQENGYFFSMEQKNFNLRRALLKSREFRYKDHCRSDRQLDAAINKLKLPEPVEQ